MSVESTVRYSCISFVVILILGICFPHSIPVTMAGGILRGALLATGLALVAARYPTFAVLMILFIVFYEPSMGRNVYTQTSAQEAEQDYYGIGVFILIFGLSWNAVETEMRRHPKSQPKTAQRTGYGNGPRHAGQI